MTPMKYITHGTFVLLQQAGRIGTNDDGALVMRTKWPAGYDHPEWIEESVIHIREHKAFDWRGAKGWVWVP